MAAAGGHGPMFGLPRSYRDQAAPYVEGHARAAFDMLPVGARTFGPHSKAQHALLWANQIASGIYAGRHYLNPRPAMVHSCLNGCFPVASPA